MLTRCKNAVRVGWIVVAAVIVDRSDERRASQTSASLD